MKRMLFLALILIFFFQVVFPTSVLAEETQSIFENTDTSQDQGNPHSFATMRLTPFQSVLGALGTPFNWSIVGNVIPSVSSEDEKNFTDLTPFVDHFTSPMSWLVPGYFTLTKPYIPFTTGQPSSYHYCAILLIDAPHVLTVGPYYFVTTKPEITEDIPWRPPLYEKLQFFGTIWSGFAMGANEDGTLNFDKPKRLISGMDTAACGRRDQPIDQEPVTQNVRQEAYFSEGYIDSHVTDNVLMWVVQKIKDTFGRIIETFGEWVCCETLNIPLKIRLTEKGEDSGSHLLSLASYDATDRELADDVSKHTRTQTDGSNATLVPFSQRKDLIGWSGTPNNVKLAAVDAGTNYVKPETGVNRFIETTKQAECAKHSYQVINGKGAVPAAYAIGGKIPIADSCAAPSLTPGAGDVCGVASAYNIPCCQLKGVMELETGSGANTGNGSCSTSQGNFNCCTGVGCGPAQISCGQYDAYAGGDNLDLCSPEGSAELLSRAMLLKLCQADGKCDSYNWTKWGEFVKKNYQVDDGDYTAAAYFHGLQNGCTVSGCTQYRWGAWKGYCDAVESYCTTGQVLPDNTAPEFCEECNQEVINSGLPPMQCSP